MGSWFDHAETVRNALVEMPCENIKALRQLLIDRRGVVFVCGNGDICFCSPDCTFSNGFGQIRQEIKRGFQLSNTLFSFFMQDTKRNFVFFLTAMSFF